MMTMPATPGDFFCSMWIGLIREFGWIPLCAHSIAAFLGVWEKEDLHHRDLRGVGSFLQIGIPDVYITADEMHIQAYFRLAPLFICLSSCVET